MTLLNADTTTPPAPPVVCMLEKLLEAIPVPQIRDEVRAFCQRKGLRTVSDITGHNRWFYRAHPDPLGRYAEHLLGNALQRMRLDFFVGDDPDVVVEISFIA
jgi:hypothetical protein